MESRNQAAADEIVDNLQIAATALERIKDSHSRVISAPTVSLMARPPFMVAAYREGLTCRFVETLDAIITVFRAKQFAAAITLTHSLMSTAAAMLELCSKVDASLRRASLREIEDFLERAYADGTDRFGARVSNHVGTGALIQRINADFPLFREQCEELFALDGPEWLGTGRLYAGGDTGQCSMAFRDRLSKFDRPIVLMASVLRLTALAYEHFDRKLGRNIAKLWEIDGGRQSARSASIGDLVGHFGHLDTARRPT